MCVETTGAACASALEDGAGREPLGARLELPLLVARHRLDERLLRLLQLEQPLRERVDGGLHDGKQAAGQRLRVRRGCGFGAVGRERAGRGE